MMPPHCALCGKESELGDHRGFQLVTFADYRPLPEGITGHPDGLVWFCAVHVDEAKALSHLNSRDALGSLVPKTT